MSTARVGLPGRWLDVVTSQRWLLAFAALYLLAELVGGIQYHLGLQALTDASGQVVTGDFPAFYTAGHMVATGHGAQLYELAAQKEAQDVVLGRRGEVWQPFPYPPLLAIAMAGLAPLGALAAFRVHAACMLLVLCFGLWSLRAALPWHRADPIRACTSAMLVLGFAPLFRTVIGGQNTPLTFGLLAAALGAFAQNRSVLAGALLGLCSYKPQLLPFLLLSLLVATQWRALLACAAVCVLHYVLGALVIGVDWPRAMLEMLARYEATEHAVNLGTHISAIAVIREADAGVAGWIACAVVWAGLFVLVVRSARSAATPGWALGVALAAALLGSPHLQYYDVSLVALPVLLAADLQLQRAGTLSRLTRGLLVCGFLAYPIYAFAPQLGFQPLLLWLVVPLVGLWRVQPRASRTL